MRSMLRGRAARLRLRSRPHRRAAARPRRSRIASAGRPRRTRRPADGSRRRRPRAAARSPARTPRSRARSSTRSIRSSPPSSACRTDSAFSAHQRAASAPCSTVRSRAEHAGVHEHAVVIARAAARSAQRGRRSTTTASSGSWGGNGPGSVSPSSASRSSIRHSQRSQKKSTLSRAVPQCPPSNTSCTSASWGAPSVRVDLPQRRDRRRARRRPGR